mmetsp:Transcript_3949/g.6599  ORF Transcript_3949/g.6599 Transcript_3949/m.6599 type:complete len:454 (-) Transcript_3949:244-1605(-)
MATIPPTTPAAQLTDAAAPAIEWPTDSSVYSFLGKIGQGAFASVWKAETHTGSDDQQSHYCAVKVLNLDHVDSDLNEIRMEVQLMRLSLHPNILPCHTAFLAQTQLWVVTPFMNKGSAVHGLQEARRKLKRQHTQKVAAGREASTLLSLEPHILYILHQTLLGLQYIHDNGQIHRDVKGSNILLDGSASVRVADFGVSGWLIPQNEKAKTFVGTPCWMAPEVMEQIHGYDYKADMWSLGITALELAKGYAPYARYPPMKVLILTIQEEPPSLDTYDYDETDYDDNEEDDYPQEWTSNFRQLISWLLQKDPAQRPTCQELLQSPLLATAVSQETLAQEICSVVSDVGGEGGSSSNHATQERGPGQMPAWIDSAEDRPAGTTWVFADGSQVLVSDAKEKEVDDVLSEFDQFCGETGGENYAKKEEEAKAAEQDDMDDFLDEFENLTSGENFQRQV